MPLIDALLALSPHVVVQPADDGGTLVWVDARGLSARGVAAGVLAAARAHQRDPAAQDALRVGAARVAIAAEVAARWSRRTVTGIAPQAERAFLAPFPLTVLLDTTCWVAPGRPAAGTAGGTTTGGARADLTPAAVRRTVSALADVGIQTCGELAALAPDAVAVRFGAPGAALWALARADDDRRLFARAPRDLPCASVEWATYELRDPERLAFVAHRLVERVVTEVHAWGDAARTLVLRFALAGGGAHETLVRGARASADVATWSRLVRTALERVVLPDGVIGLALRVDATSLVDSPQGDLFDRGFQSGAAAEAAVSRLIDDGAGVPVQLTATGHALPERRVTCRPLEFRDVAGVLRVRPPQHTAAASAASGAPGTTTTTPGTARGRVVPAAPASRTASSGASAASDPHVGSHVVSHVVSLDAVRARRAAGAAAPSSRAPAPPAPAPLNADVDEALALRVLPEPRPIVVTTRLQRGDRVPTWYRERLVDGARARRGMPLVEVVAALGPELVSVGHEAGAPVGRTYWQCFTSDVRFVLLYHDTSAPPGATAEEIEHGTWYLAGWWD